MNKNPDNRKALGKGLSALLPGRTAAKRAPEPAPAETAASTDGSGIQQIEIAHIDPNPLQPRNVFQAERLNELAQSIRVNGIIQPIILQRNGDRYQLVAGERRWRAAKLAGLAAVPAVIQEYAAERLLEVALIENIQREDLNPMEVAHALQQLAQDHNLSHEEIGNRTGKDRTTVTNLLRLLKLGPEVQLLVAEQRLSMGHARAILGLTSEELQREVAERVAAEGFSVRQTERLVQSLNLKQNSSESKSRETPEYDPDKDPNVAAATRELEAALGTKVRVSAQSPDRGRIEIEYFSFEELDRIYNQIIGAGRN